MRGKGGGASGKEEELEGRDTAEREKEKEVRHAGEGQAGGTDLKGRGYSPKVGSVGSHGSVRDGEGGDWRGGDGGRMPTEGQGGGGRRVRT